MESSMCKLKGDARIHNNFPWIYVLLGQLSPAALWSEAFVCSYLTAGIVDSDPAEGMDVYFLCLLGVVQVAAAVMSWPLVQRSPTRCVCLTVYELQEWGSLGPSLTVVLTFLLHGAQSFLRS
jgi:hypothetical protein